MASKISGQVIIRDHGVDDQTGRPNQRIVSIFGILSLPEGSFKTDHQYTVVGNGDLSLVTIMPDGKDLSAEIKGNTPSGILCEPIWRV